jgi:hypothetical protein
MERRKALISIVNSEKVEYFQPRLMELSVKVRKFLATMIEALRD